MFRWFCNFEIYTKNTSKMRYFLLIFFTLSVTFLQAQNVSVTVECPRIVRVGEPFQMDILVNANCSNPKLPDMQAFSIVRNLGKSQNSQVSIANGKITQSVEIAFSYVMQANREGTQEIGPVEVTVDNKTYQSAPVTVQVVSGNQSTQVPNNSSGTEIQPDNSQVQADSREMFLEVLTDRKQIYQGEYITATLKFFSKIRISGFGDKFTLPTFDGFFKQEVETPPLRSLNTETIDGEAYATGVIRQYILFPQKSGTLTISPSTLEALIPQRVQTRSRSVFDDFWGGGIQNVPREVTSRPVNITVLPLPEEGKPASFTGGVGQMKLNASVDKTELKANDPVTLKVTISGTGNMRFVDAPRVNFPPDFEVYDPKINTNLNATITSGSKTFEYLVIPRHEGTYKIPAVEFGYFDPQAKQYKTLRSEEFTLNVSKGDDQPGSTVVSGITREDVKYLGQDVRYIKTGKMKLDRIGNIFFGTWKFWLWYLIPLCGFIVIVYFRRKYIRKYADVALVKNKKANRYAAKRLKQARSFMDKGQQEQFYEELSRALWGYLSDKLNIPVAELSKDNAKLVMEQHHVDPALADTFIGVIDDCEFARYAPSAAGSDVNVLYNRAVEVINTMQKVIQ